jgi:hypothetical protein
MDRYGNCPAVPATTKTYNYANGVYFTLQAYRIYSVSRSVYFPHQFNMKIRGFIQLQNGTRVPAVGEATFTVSVDNNAPTDNAIGKEMQHTFNRECAAIANSAMVVMRNNFNATGATHGKLVIGSMQGQMGSAVLTTDLNNMPLHLSIYSWIGAAGNPATCTFEMPVY